MTGAVVALGGGHGLAATLRALAPTTQVVTAVVSTADDGGSTGRLREVWEVPAPGDVRRCLAALAPDGGIWQPLLAQRFDAGDLKGHAVGNLVLLALAEQLGSLQAACDEVARASGIDPSRARVVPATDAAVVLHGQTSGGHHVNGQVAIAATTEIDEVWVEPRDAPASIAAIAAIAGADQIVLGPGSLFTSVLAAVVVGELRQAVSAAGAQVVLVSNLRADQAETAGFDVAGHVAALARHGVAVDAVIAHPGSLPVGELEVRLVATPVAAANGLVHDPVLLGRTLLALRS